MLEDGKKYPTDSDPAPWRDLLRDFEAAGLVDCTINGHELQRPTLDDESESYRLQPKVRSID